MRKPLHWLLDFDDTLCVGMITWAYEKVFPEFVQRHHLPFERGLFDSAFMNAQKRANEDPGPEPIIIELFESMAWPKSLLSPLFTAILEGYMPALFEDAIPFLSRLQTNGRRAYIVSNNPNTPRLAAALGISDLVLDIITPVACDNTRPKPDPSLWHCLVSRYPTLAASSAVVVGDDPWSDGIFSERCGLPCSIIDRSGRLAALRSTHAYHWAESLLEIPLT